AAVRDRERAPREELTVPCGRFVLHLPVDDLKRIVVRGRRTDGTHNGRRPLVERLVTKLLQSTFDAIVEKQKRLGMLASQSDFRPVTELLAPGTVKKVTDQLWPVLTPEHLLAALYAGPKRRARVCRDLLADDEQELLQRAVDDDSWTDADVSLLDESATLLGTVPVKKARSRVAENIDEAMVERVMADTVEIPDCPVCGSELSFEPRGEPGSAVLRCDVCEPKRFFRAGDLIGDDKAQLLATVHASLSTRHMIEEKADVRVGDLTYGHVVVDEAQDLSAMQWRALARRCPPLSMTVVGDQGQAIRPGGTGSWEAAMAAVGAPTFELAELTVNYRTPVEVMEAAEAVLAESSVPFSRTRSVRSTQPPVVTEVRTITADLVQSIIDGLDVEGTHAVIAPAARCDALAAVGAIDVLEAKGLEFDAVVVVDPEGIADEGEGAARRVYVALTRTTTVLHVVRETS
ncbi:MAG: hypothetical protein QOD30_1993, partial [Actinomycetota bacterium]|nr:hypothetical protein [Actinomycetota bacterium]